MSEGPLSSLELITSAPFGLARESLAAKWREEQKKRESCSHFFDRLHIVVGINLSFFFPATPRGTLFNLKYNCAAFRQA